MFGPQVDAFRDSHRLIRPDLRGNGRSGRLVGPIRTILDRQCDDMIALLDHLGIIKVVMIGVSYGGTVAFHFALRHPDRLAGLVIVDSFAELRIAQPMEALLLVGSYLTLWAYYLPRPRSTHRREDVGCASPVRWLAACNVRVGGDRSWLLVSVRSQFHTAHGPQHCCRRLPPEPLLDPP